MWSIALLAGELNRSSVLAAESKYAAGLIDTVAGDGSPDLTRPTTINNPFGVEIGPDGCLYITEVGGHRVHRLDLKTGQRTVVAGTGQKGYSGDGGPATQAQLNEPYEVRFDRQGNLYFVEMQNHLVRKVDAKTGLISTIAGTGKAGFGGDGGPALQAQFKQPHSIALDDRGQLYVADIGNHRIRRIDLATGTVDTVAGTGEKKLPQDGQSTVGQPILGPRALFITGRTLWIALREGNSVWRMDLDAQTLHHVAGTGKTGYTGDGQAALSATFAGPKGIVVGPDQGVYVVDTENQAIRRIDVHQGTILTVAGSGPMHKGDGGDGGPAVQAQMRRPHGICAGPDGTLYIGDSENHKVRRVRFGS